MKRTWRRGSFRGRMRFLRERWPAIRRCVCSVDNEPEELFSVCGVPCRAAYHKHWWIRREILRDDRNHHKPLTWRAAARFVAAGSWS